MRRRDFLLRSGALMAMVGLFKKPPADYRPIGYLRAGDPGAMDVETVTVDGHRLTHVFELNDVEGWVRRYTSTVSGVAVVARYEGDVRVTWRSV